jgi:hypothetical protein
MKMILVRSAVDLFQAKIVKYMEPPNRMPNLPGFENLEGLMHTGVFSDLPNLMFHFGTSSLSSA